MKKIFSLAMLLVCAWQYAMATVTITAPTKPTSLDAEIVEGKSYCLYNLRSGRFVGYNSYLRLDAADTMTVKAGKNADGSYAFTYNNGSTYIYSSSSYIYVGQSSNDQYTSFSIVESGTGVYKIQVAPANTSYYDANNWWGTSSSSNYVVRNGSINNEWMFIPETVCSDPDKVAEAKLYGAKVLLYAAIVAADVKGNHVEAYEAKYNDASQTNDNLLALATQLENSDDLTNTYNYILADLSNYPIKVTGIGDWEGSSSNRRLQCYYYGTTTGQKNTINTSVYVDQPSTFFFDFSSSARWTNAPSVSFKVYVDGEVVYEYNGETYQYSYDNYFDDVLHGSFSGSTYRPYGERYSYSVGYIERPRHFINLEAGHHLIDIETTKRYTNSICFYLSGLGVKKVPEISVNLAKEGTLNDEVLRAMDNSPLYPEKNNIRNVRKLKISGVIGDADWEYIYNMDTLFSIDLADADIKEIKKEQLSLYAHPSLGYLHELKLPKNLATIGQEAFSSSYIEDVDIPESVTSIGDYAFWATRQRHANIPNVKTLGHNAFRECTMLEDATMRNVDDIGINVFDECYNITNVVFDGTPIKVPERMFRCCSKIETISIPESVTNVEQYAFYLNRKAKTTKLPDGLKIIGDWAFHQNYSATFALPEGLETIGNYGFNNVTSATGNIPSTLKSVGDYGFASSFQNLVPGKPDTLYLAPNATYAKGTFMYCGVKNYVIPATYYNLGTAEMFGGCDSLESIKILSPTMMTVASDFVGTLDKKSIKIIVPAYLYYTYLSDSYWADFNIEGFSTTEMDSIAIKQNLKLSQHDRFEGTPSVSTDAGVLFTIDGNSGMELRNMTLSNDLTTGSYSQLWTSTDLIHINGETSERFYTAANKWYFLSLPFDCDLKRTVNEKGAQYAIRYYDGAQRATYSHTAYPESAHNYADNMTEDTPSNKQTFSKPGATSLKIVFNSATKTYNSSDLIYIQDASGNITSYYGSIGAKEVTLSGDRFDIWIVSNGSYGAYGYSIDAIYADGELVEKNPKKDNWKDYDCSSDIIKAGTGFIFMTSQNSWTRFYSVDNGTKQTVFFAADNENNEQHFALQKNESVVSSNRGWNLVGNPYPNYYNNHRISFSAPITLWTGSTYQAYSLRDDDIAIKPCQAIFVQCPEDVAEISFPAAGRQTTDEITDQANARPIVGVAVTSSRRLFDISLTGENGEDKTRVVLNDEAALGYELSCDAAKFMSMDASVPQIYSVDTDDTKYAINERPVSNGTVLLGALFPKSGEYTIALARAAAAKVLLTDNETGETTNITNDEYTFSAEAGTSNARFSLSFENVVTAADAVETPDDETTSERIYTIDGRMVNGITAPGTYIVRGKKGTRKVVNK